MPSGGVHPITRLRQSRAGTKKSRNGHEERFPPTRLSAGCRFRKETIDGMRRNGRDAPFPVIRGTTVRLRGCVETRRSAFSLLVSISMLQKDNSPTKVIGSLSLRPVTRVGAFRNHVTS